MHALRQKAAAWLDPDFFWFGVFDLVAILFLFSFGSFLGMLQILRRRSDKPLMGDLTLSPPGLTISFSLQIPVFSGNEIAFRNFGEFRPNFFEF